MKCLNIGVPEGMELEKVLEGLFQEIIIENFPDLEKERDNQVQEAHRTPDRHDQKRYPPQHIVIKHTTVKQ